MLLLDHIVGQRQHGGRDAEIKRFGDLLVDGEFEHGRQLDRDRAGCGAAKYQGDLCGYALAQRDAVWAVTDAR